MCFEAHYAKNYASILYQCLTHTHKHTHNFSISNNFGIFPQRFGSGSETIDELYVVLGGQPSPFFYNRIREKKFSLQVVNDNEIVRNTSDRVEGKPVFLFGALFETVGADVFLVMPLTMGRNKTGVGWPPKTMRNSPTSTKGLLQCQV